MDELQVFLWPSVFMNTTLDPGLEIATDMVANATNFFSLATKIFV